jgi:hypothetical protein
VPAEQEPVAAKIGRGAGQLFGAGRGAVVGAVLGVVKGGVALTDKMYEDSSSRITDEHEREQFHSKVNFAARAAAAELAPVVGAFASSFVQGAREGSDAAYVANGTPNAHRVFAAARDGTPTRTRTVLCRCQLAAASQRHAYAFAYQLPQAPRAAHGVREGGAGERAA